jgi:hypothetical protein
MAVQTFYGFIQEEAFKLSSRMELGSGTETKFGTLTGESYNYLVSKAILNDSRTSRLTVADNTTPNGKISLMFDSDRFDSTLLNTDNLTETEQNHLFNIIESVVFRDKQTDSGLESILSSDKDLYDGYVAKSFLASSDSDTGVFLDTTKTQHTFTFTNWIEFAFKTAENTITFHLWLAKESFKENYPFVTITAIIPPAPLDILCDPNTLANYTNVNLMTSSSTYIFDQTNLETVARDQNGIYTFTTKYVLSSTKSIQIPFALAYCGASAPDSLECRKYIREYLEKNAPVTISVLQQIMPDVYITCRFYMVPLWDVYTTRTERDVYNSIWKLSTINSKLQKLFPDTDDDYIEQYAELITNAQFKAMTVVLPDSNNGDTWSILELHPTYQDYSSQVPGWKYMTTEDQEFASKLNRVMAILNGDLVSEEFLTTSVGGATYLVFSSGTAEYLVMESTSYKKLLKNR